MRSGGGFQREKQGMAQSNFQRSWKKGFQTNRGEDPYSICADVPDENRSSVTYSLCFGLGNLIFQIQLY